MVNQKYTTEKLTKLFTENSNYLQNQLMFGGMQLMLIEFLKKWMKDQLEGFFGSFKGLDKNGECLYLVEEKYSYLFKKNIDGHPFDKQLQWFVEKGAINEDEGVYLSAMRHRRNEVGHELIRLITDDKRQELIWEECKAIANLLFKMDNWWFRQIDVPTGLLSDHEEITEEDLENGSSVAINILLNFVERVNPETNK
ncbi:hypothetical protein [Paremcibacter congregatus]|uniref:hypothetical protein n=1 Tax=Paremcibacter congregatus TaxID=2043170 RepID=UPI0030EB4A5B|tara:strand:+ start:1032 stop:1622 length:591 start_codon:yes stop_codon:yes gene_type:complete